MISELFICVTRPLKRTKTFIISFNGQKLQLTTRNLKGGLNLTKNLFIIL